LDRNGGSLIYRCDVGRIITVQSGAHYHVWTGTCRRTPGERAGSDVVIMSGLHGCRLRTRFVCVLVYARRKRRGWQRLSVDGVAIAEGAWMVIAP